MRRKHSWMALTALVGSAFGLMAGSAAATPAVFGPNFGFEPAGLGGLPEITIDRNDPFETAADELAPGGPYAVELSGTGALCILASGESTCRSNAVGIVNPYSVIMSFQVSAVNTESIDDEFVLVVTNFFDPTGLGQYDENDLDVELTPMAPAGLETSAVAGFLFDGSFDAFTHVVDIDSTPPASPPPGYQARYDYIGWRLTMADVGDRVISLRYEVRDPAANGAIPGIMMNAVPIIPEPGTALLLGLGLAGLASVRRAPLAEDID